ncbi:hypothetical protein FAGAP_6316 [Fusarium agapanthi]|uniref:Uncharacterized protein n=1 Tax=Fusarium agapanthi TaxID=1803897 RepID=A0A9P5BBA8_9HYPO|nr:hypothetical protein FAGAP_6316 [Fusarium agapanthi]
MAEDEKTLAQRVEALEQKNQNKLHEMEDRKSTSLRFARNRALQPWNMYPSGILEMRNMQLETQLRTALAEKAKEVEEKERLQEAMIGEIVMNLRQALP